MACLLYHIALTKTNERLQNLSTCGS